MVFRGLLIFSFIAISMIYYINLTDERYSFEEMDLNNDGVISLLEASYVSDSGMREVIKANRKCTEYFAHKDGLLLKVVCKEAL